MIGRVTATETHRAIEAVWRIEQARLIAGLARMVRDVGLAEELAQDALVAALEQWPETGIPDNPGAWLMATAKHRAIDQLPPQASCASASTRSSAATSRSSRSARRPISTPRSTTTSATICCGLIFTACHPVLSPEARVALTLRLLGGLTTDEIARAFLVPEPTIAQRIVRAKRTLAEAGVPFEVPRGAELADAARLGARGHLPHLQRGLRGDRRRRLDAARSSARRRCASAASSPSLAPSEPEVHGLVALMEIQASRLGARIGPDGEPILLLDQNRARWDQLLIRRGLAALARAEALGAARAPTRCRPRSPPATRARGTAGETDWPRIAALYDDARRGRPVAGGRAQPRRRGGDGRSDRPPAWRSSTRSPPSRRSQDYHLLPSVRGDLLAKLGRHDEARAEFERAAALTRNARERDLLLERARDSGERIEA